MSDLVADSLFGTVSMACVLSGMVLYLFGVISQRMFWQCSMASSVINLLSDYLVHHAFDPWAMGNLVFAFVMWCRTEDDDDDTPWRKFKEWGKNKLKTFERVLLRPIEQAQPA